MQVIGFNFTKITAVKHPHYAGSSSINTNIEFTDVVKEDVPLLKGAEASRIAFEYSVAYESQDKKKDDKMGELVFEGNIVLSLVNDELKNIQKAWKKKQLTNDIKVPLFNLILKKCAPKVLLLTDETGLPSPIPLPKITTKPQQ